MKEVCVCVRFECYGEKVNSEYVVENVLIRYGISLVGNVGDMSFLGPSCTRPQGLHSWQSSLVSPEGMAFGEASRPSCLAFQSFNPGQSFLQSFELQLWPFDQIGHSRIAKLSFLDVTACASFV
ncbi:hypothetical protein Tco_0897297, partial [Tanacetum coccineum]